MPGGLCVSDVSDSTANSRSFTTRGGLCSHNPSRPPVHAPNVSDSSTIYILNGAIVGSPRTKIRDHRLFNSQRELFFPFLGRNTGERSCVSTLRVCPKSGVFVENGCKTLSFL